MKSNSKSIKPKFLGGVFQVLFMLIYAGVLQAQPTFTKSFSPDQIGPGSSTTLTFEIDNTDQADPVSDLAFTDTLPAGVAIATPSSALTTCTNGILSAPDGGATISLSGGQVGANSMCTVTVNVTGSPIGTHTNVSGELTSSVGMVAGATADLIVDGARPGFSKSFAPGSIPLGSTSTLTLTIDNTNGGSINTLSFTDQLPAGMIIATPANAATTCPGGSITAISGTSSIFFLGSVGAESSCFVAVDVTTDATGVFLNNSGELLQGVEGISSGFATAALNVPVEFLVKSFIDDPVPPGGNVTLKFTVTNLDRDNPATAISFDDSLDPLGSLTGLAPNEALPKSACGGTLDFAAGTLSLTGGSLPAAGSCTFNVELAVPAEAPSGTFTNITDPVTADIGGDGVVGNEAVDNLIVSLAPILTKEFTDDPVGAGGSVTLQFTITNTSSDSILSDIAFIDELTTFLPFPISVALPPTPDPPCGVGSSMSVVSLADDREGLSLTGGSLSAGGSCTFDVIVDIPVGFPAGTYLNTTSDINALIGGEEPVSGKPASGDLVVVAGPTLRKEFTNDPVEPGGTVNLEFTLIHDPFATANATGITFTDNLNAALTGLVATGLPLSDLCGAGNGSLTGSAMDSMLTFSGMELAPGATCTFSVTLQVPATAAAGSHTNTTSSVVANVLGLETIGNAAADDLKIAGLVLTKEFTDDPVLPGGTVNLRFKIENVSPTSDAANIFFEDDLASTLAGLTATGLPMNNVCGNGSSLQGSAGNTFLTFNGGSLAVGEPCTFDVTLQVPAGAASGTYNNRTSLFNATLEGPPVFFDNATDNLIVSNDLLLLTKEFTDDPVAPGGTVTLQFSLSNLDVLNAAMGIAFTDNLDATLTGLVATGLPLATPQCGAGSQLSGTSSLTFTGGNLAPGDNCTFEATLMVPSSGVQLGTTFPNTTSQVTGTIGGLGVVGNPAIDNLRIDFLNFTKAFGGPAVAGGTEMLNFTIVNLDPNTSANGIGFTDDLGSVIPGLVAIGLPESDVCGPGSMLTGTSFLKLTGGNLLPGGSCSFSILLQIPVAAQIGSFPNTTSELFMNGLSVSSPASADLEVFNPVIDIQKTPDNQTIAAGGNASFTIKVTNTGNDSLDNVTVTDALTPNCNATLGTLGVGEMTSYNCSLDNVTADFTNTATVTADSAGGLVSVSDNALVEVVAENKTFTGPTATGTGDATISFNGGGLDCGFSQISYIPLEGGPMSPPAGSAPEGLSFPHGLVTFIINGACTPGFTASFTWKLPSELPPDTQYWKYGPTPDKPTPHWYELPATVAGNTITFNVTDGGLGDNDLTVNGIIVDPSGPGVSGVIPPPPPPPPRSVKPIPFLKPEILMLLSGLLALAALSAIRRRRLM